MKSVAMELKETQDCVVGDEHGEAGARSKHSDRHDHDEHEEEEADMVKISGSGKEEVKKIRLMRALVETRDPSSKVCLICLIN